MEEAAEEEEEEKGDAKEEQGGEDLKEKDGEKSSAVKLVGQVLSDGQMRFEKIHRELAVIFSVTRRSRSDGSHSLTH